MDNRIRRRSYHLALRRRQVNMSRYYQFLEESRWITSGYARDELARGMWGDWFRYTHLMPEPRITRALLLLYGQ